jgi:hypothetical protein
LDAIVTRTLEAEKAATPGTVAPKKETPEGFVEIPFQHEGDHDNDIEVTRSKPAAKRLLRTRKRATYLMTRKKKGARNSAATQKRKKPYYTRTSRG